MSIIPEFGIGLWNTWIFILPLLTVHVVTSKILKSRGAEGQPSKSMMIIFLLLHILPLFMPLDCRTRSY